jgi:hypothetical protein
LGRWTHDAIYQSYLKFYKLEGLLAMGGWPNAAQKDLTTFWHERFHAPVSEELISLVYPFLRGLEEIVERMGKRATNSMKSAPKVLRYLAMVVIQDSLELAEKYPAHPVHQTLLQNAAFRYVISYSVYCPPVHSVVLTQFSFKCTGSNLDPRNPVMGQNNPAGRLPQNIKVTLGSPSRMFSSMQ